MPYKAHLRIRKQLTGLEYIIVKYEHAHLHTHTHTYKHTHAHVDERNKDALRQGDTSNQAECLKGLFNVSVILSEQVGGRK